MKTTGIYVQIPFCASKCSFCNFSSRVARPGVFKKYCAAICREIERLPEIIARQGIEGDILTAPVDTVYFGGGTPAIVGLADLTRIVECLRRNYHMSADSEFTVETTPGSADEEFLRRARSLGINRLSIGAQSFCDRELKVVGRLHTAQDTITLVQSARSCGFDNISLDLIAGLPQQTADSWHSSLEVVRDLRPEHVSVYIFEIDEKSRLGREVVQHGSRYHADEVPGEDFMAEAYESAREFLVAAGYGQYEISNFALPGFESRHNRKYWRLEPYLGFGAGAHSFDGSRRWSNVTEPENYCTLLDGNGSPIEDFRTLSAREQLEEFFFLGLRQSEGIDLHAAAERWNLEMVSRWEPIIVNLVNEGRLERHADQLSMPQQGFLVSNEIFQEFLLS